MSATQQLLDQVQSLARIAELEADPRAYADRLASEIASADTLAELEQRDELLRRVLGQLESMIERVMRIRLDNALAGDTSIAIPTRKVFAATIAGYAERIELLASRARDVAERGGAPDPDRAAANVVEAARATLALRNGVRNPVLALIRELAAAAVPVADRNARDRQLDEPVRRRWSAARRELAAVAGDPQRIVASSLAARIAAWPEQLDEPAEDEATFADMIEID